MIADRWSASGAPIKTKFFTASKGGVWHFRLDFCPVERARSIGFSAKHFIARSSRCRLFLALILDANGLEVFSQLSVYVLECVMSVLRRVARSFPQ
jgi:hypothetical protein